VLFVRRDGTEESMPAGTCLFEELKEQSAWPRIPIPQDRNRS